MISKKQVITFILILFIQYGYSQNRFEQGYYISNSGSKTDCLIEKKEWAIWSNDFFYATINGSVKQIKIEDVKEFGIENKLKFITKEVEIEKSSDNINKLDKSSDFVFNKERILLKVIVEGDLSLYQYLDFNVKKLFFKTITGNITQLKYKRYSNETNKTINAIIEYKNQLRKNMKCSNIDFKELNFELISIKKYVLNQNKCSNSKINFIEKRVTQTKLLISGSVGLNTSNLNINRSQKVFSLNSTDPTFGIDFNFLIPTIRNEMEVNFKTSYNAFKIKEDVNFGSSSREIKVNYSEVLLGIGGGYRFHIDNDKSISFRSGINYPILLSNTTYTETGSNLDLSTKKANPFLSISSSMHIKKINLMAEYFFKRNIIKGIDNFQMNLNRIVFKVSYELF